MPVRSRTAAARSLADAVSGGAHPSRRRDDSSSRAAAVRERTGIDTAPIYERAARARYAPEPPPRGEGAAAWRDLSRAIREIRRQAPLRRRVTGALGLRPRRRGTVTG